VKRGTQAAASTTSSVLNKSAEAAAVAASTTSSAVARANEALKLDHVSTKIHHGIHSAAASAADVSQRAKNAIKGRDSFVVRERQWDEYASEVCAPAPAPAIRGQTKRRRAERPQRRHRCGTRGRPCMHASLVCMHRRAARGACMQVRAFAHTTPARIAPAVLSRLAGVGTRVRAG
jgi:hypothetical protein